jgi:hypothetical protein
LEADDDDEECGAYRIPAVIEPELEMRSAAELKRKVPWMEPDEVWMCVS